MQIIRTTYWTRYDKGVRDDDTRAALPPTETVTTLTGLTEVDPELAVEETDVEMMRVLNGGDTSSMANRSVAGSGKGMLSAGTV